MKKLIIITIAGLAALASCNGNKSSIPFNGLVTTSDSLSYFMGSNYIPQMTTNSVLAGELNNGAFIQGLKDQKGGSPLLVSEAEVQKIAQKLFNSKRNDTTKTEVKVPESFTYDFKGLNSPKDSLSYYMGVNIFMTLERSGMKELIEPNLILKGMEDVFNKDSILVDNTTGNQIAMRYAKKAQEAEMEKLKIDGEAFLNAKSKLDDVITLPSGLRYKIITNGTGKKPKADDGVSTHYHGTLIDGTVFDSSVERGEPIEFLANKVIPGWSEALQLMPVGSKWELYIPYNLAYGERGSQKIPPFSPLVFEVELMKILSVKEKEALILKQEEQLRQMQMQQQLQQQAQMQQQ